MANTEITRIQDHVARGCALLITQYREQPEVVAWLTSYLNWVQKLEDGVWQIILSRDLATAVGVQLDVIGRLLGLGRGGFDRNGVDDESYRAALAVRIRILRSFGTMKDFDEILTALTSLMGGDWRFTELYPMRVRVTLYNVGYDPYLLAEVMIGAKLAGVALELFFTALPRANVFRFSPGARLGGSTRGFNAGAFAQRIV